MTAHRLRNLLDGNRAHTDTLPDGAFDDVQEMQRPPIVSMCCSDSRIPQEGMWSIDHPGVLFTPSTIGNQVWDTYRGNRVVDGSLLYPIHYTGTDTAIVVGHTGCGAVTAAYRLVTGTDHDYPAGVEKWVRSLVSIVEDGLSRIAAPVEDEIVNQLVEYNVDRQIEFLVNESTIPPELDCFGFVYDFQRIYGDIPGRTYLVNVNGETDVGKLRGMLPDEYDVHVRRLRADPE